MEAEDDCVVIMKNFLKELNDCRTSPTGEDYVHLRSGIIGNYSLKPEEVEGEVVDWALQFLEQRKCPADLASAMAKYVSEQMKNLIQEEKIPSNSNSQSDNSNSYLEAVHLHMETLRHLHDLSEYWYTHSEQMVENTSLFKRPHYVTSICTIKNGRRKMEDRYTVLHDLNTLCRLPNEPHYSYYGVFDGHAGIRAANYSAAHLHANIAHNPIFLTDPIAAIKEGFKITDNQILERSKGENTKSGCTVVCSFIEEKFLYVAWVGDSQAILVRDGNPFIVTNPHKPDRQDEKQRIENLNGCVMFIGTWRVNGTLAVSRALGDLEHKPYVSAEPDIVTIPLRGNEDFFVLACDGLWDRLNPSDVASSIYSYIVEHPTNNYEDVASRLVQQAKECGSSDNITAIVVFLKHPKELAVNPKNPPPYSFQLDGSKVDNWYQGSWNGMSENSNNGLSSFNINDDSVIKPNSLGLCKTDDLLNMPELRNFYFNPLNSEAYGTNEYKDISQSNTKGVMPEKTAFSELPTPPIDELLASQQFGISNELTFASYEMFENKSCVTLVDSGILDQEASQNKQLYDNSLRDDSSTITKHENLTNNTTVEIASEIVNNAIELAVSQVLVRTSSQSSQHPDDSGLEEGPLEESDESAESKSPELDAKIDDHLQFDNKLTQNIENTYEYSESQIVSLADNFQHTLISQTEMDSFAFSGNNIKQIENDQEEIHLLSHTTSDILDLSEAKDVIQAVNSPLVEFDSTALTPSLDDEETLTNSAEHSSVAIHNEINLKNEMNLDDQNHVKDFNQSNLIDLVINDTSTVQNTETCIIESSPFPSEVGELLERLTDKEKPVSNILLEDIPANIAAVDLVVIPEGVPEAEGVTEDSDSEKDGGWSYIRGEKTIASKKPVVSKVSTITTIKQSSGKKIPPVSTPANKTTKKPITIETKFSQQKSSNVLKKKAIPEKTGKDKLSSTMTKNVIPKTLPTTRMQKVTSDQSKKISTSLSATSKANVHINKPQSKESISSRPKSAPVISSSSNKVSMTKITVTSAPKTSTRTTQANTTQTTNKVQKSTEQIKSTTANTNIAIPKISSKKPPMAVTSRIVTKSVSVSGHTISTTQSKPFSSTLKVSPITKSSSKPADIKQTKDSANIKISTKPSLTKSKEFVAERNKPSVFVKKSSSVQSSLSSRVNPASKARPTKPSSSAIKATNSINETKVNIIKSKGKQKPVEKPKENQQSDPEKGTLEELTKEIVPEAILLEENQLDIKDEKKSDSFCPQELAIKLETGELQK